MAYRWAHTDAALTDQLELEAEGHPGVLEPGHAAVRFTNPTTGGDALPTMRTEMHRLRAGTGTAPHAATHGSSVWQVFDGRGTVTLDGEVHRSAHGDVVRGSLLVRAVPARPDTELDLLRPSPTRRSSRSCPCCAPQVTGSMRLATIRVVGGTRAVRIDGGQAVETGHSDVGALLAAPGLARPGGGRERRAAPGLVRWTSPRWSRGPARSSASGSTTATTSSRWAASCPSTRPCSPSSPTRSSGRDDPSLARRARQSTGRPSSRSSSAAPSAAPRGGRGRGGDRRLHRAQRRHHAGLAVPHPAVAAGQDLRGDAPRSARYLVTPDELPGGVRPALTLTAAVDGETVQKADTARPGLRPGRPGRGTSPRS